MAKPTLYTPEFYAGQSGGSRESARIVVPHILKMLSVQSACDVGCGVGTWLGVLREHGVEDILGIDGDYVDQEALQIPKENFLAHDLKNPIALDRTFDLALSLEVAEHLPPKCAAQFVESLVRLAPFVLFSAAIPSQGGTGHVNEQWQDYWAELFGRHDYVPIDCIRRHIWNDDRVQRFYAQNAIIYCSRPFMDMQPHLKELADQTDPEMLSIVHPKQYRLLADRKDFKIERDAYLSQVLAMMPKLVFKAVKNRIGRNNT